MTFFLSYCWETITSWNLWETFRHKINSSFCCSRLFCQHWLVFLSGGFPSGKYFSGTRCPFQRNVPKRLSYWGKPRACCIAQRYSMRFLISRPGFVPQCSLNLTDESLSEALWRPNVLVRNRSTEPNRTMKKKLTWSYFCRSFQLNQSKESFDFYWKRSV